MIVWRFGYDITTDLHHGFTLVIGNIRKRLIIGFHFNRPTLVWYNRHYALDEPGYIQGMPVIRRKPKRWLLRGIQWQRKFEWKWWVKHD